MISISWGRGGGTLCKKIDPTVVDRLPGTKTFDCATSESSYGLLLMLVEGERVWLELEQQISQLKEYFIHQLSIRYPPHVPHMACFEWLVTYGL